MMRLRPQEARQVEQSPVRIDGTPIGPQIYIDERHVGAFDDLRALDDAGNLDAILVSRSSV
jgi:glutaredoxin